MKIAISLRIQKLVEINEKRDILSHDWIKLFNEYNFEPVLIPNNLKNLESFLDYHAIDGFILSGGDNIGDDHERDITEKTILKYAIEHTIPLFGVCRGLQVINNYFDGTHLITTNKNHVKKNHNITLSGIVSEQLDLTERNVNSFHDNIINNDMLGKDLHPFAISDSDQTVEGIFHSNFPILGVMWHPERNIDLESEKNLIKNTFHKLFWKK